MCVSKSDRKFEIYFQKTDNSLQHLELHVARANPQHVRILLDTPGSQVDRKWEAEAEVAAQSLKMSLRSPLTPKISISGQMVVQEKEQALKMEVLQNDKKLVFADIGVEQQSRGQKREFRPRLQLVWSGRELVNVGGSVSVAKGRKNQLMINLEGNQKQFLKGSLVREGDRKSADMRLSSDLTLHLVSGVEARLVTLVDKSPKQIQSDLQLEYRSGAHARKESLKTTFKAQELSSSSSSGSSAQKLSLYGEVTSTQWPHFNCHVAYNLLNKPEHVENEFTLQWNRNLEDKVHVLQVTKMADQKSIETTIQVQVTPMTVDYELRAEADHRSGQESRAQLVGKDRSGAHARYDFKAAVAYKHVSRAPLHLTLDATLKTGSGDFQYSDELRQTGSGQYKGQTQLQWSWAGSSAPKKAKMDYEYSKKSSSDKMDHQMAIELQSPLTSAPIKHYSLLRMSRQEAHLKSRLLLGDDVSHHVEALLSHQGESRVEWNALGLQVKGHAHLVDRLPQSAQLEVLHTPTEVTHRTHVEVVPYNSFRLQSDTKKRGDNLFACEADIAKNKPSKVLFNSKHVTGKVDFRSQDDDHVAQVELQHVQQDWKHSTSGRVRTSGQQLVEIQSKTLSKGRPLMTSQILINKDKRNVDFRFPQHQTALAIDAISGQKYGSSGVKQLKAEVTYGPNFRHSTQYSAQEPEIELFQSKQIGDFRSAEPLYHVEYKRSGEDHDLQGNYLQNYVLDGQLKKWDQGGRQLIIKMKNKRADQEMTNQFGFNHDKYELESRVRSNGQSVAEVDGHVIARLDRDSQIKIHLPRAQTRAQLLVTPTSGAKVQFASPLADHMTSLDWAANQYACDSKTTLTGSDVYSLAGSHIPARKSFISVKTPQYDLSGHVDQSSSAPSAKLAIVTPRMSHVTEVTGNRQQKSIRVESRADRKSGDAIYSLDGQYYHLNPQLPAQIALKVAKNLKVKAKVQPLTGSESGSRYLHVTAEHPAFSHATDLELNRKNHVVIKSVTKDAQTGSQLALVDSLIPISGFRSQRSHVVIESPKYATSFELEPQSSVAKVHFRSPRWQHDTTASGDVTDYKLEHVTKLDGQRYIQVNSFVKPRAQSLVIAGPDQWAHETHVTRDGHVYDVDSQTTRGPEVFSKIKFNSGKQLHVTFPYHSLDSQWAPETGVNVDFRSKMPSARHVLASVRLQKDQFGVDVAWDQQRDPNQRLKVQVEARDVDARAVHVLTINYAGNELKLVSDVQKRDVLYGPNTWSAIYLPKFEPERDQMEVRVSHVIRPEVKEMECALQYLEAKKEKFRSKLLTKVEPEAEGIALKLETTSAANPDLDLQVDFRSRVQQWKTKNAQLMAEVRVKRAQQKEYALQWHVARAQQSSSDDVIRGDMTLETPEVGRQEMKFEVNLQKSAFDFSAQSQDRKLLEVSARADGARPEEKHVQLEMKSNIRSIPSVAINGDYFRYKEVAFKVDVDGERKAEVSLSRTGSDFYSGQEINFRLDTPFWPKVDAKMSAKKNARQLEAEVTIKADAKEIFSFIVSGEKQTSGVWTGSARISENGAQLAQMALDSTSGPNADQLKYEFSAKSFQKKRFLPEVRILFQVETGSRKSGNRVKINVCEESQQKCFDLNALYKARAHSSSTWPEVIPERVEVNVQKTGNSFELKAAFGEQVDDQSSGESVLGLTSGRVQHKIRNQVLAAINGHQMGFESTWTGRGRSSWDNVLRIEFPNRKQIAVKTDFATPTSGQWRMKTQVMDNNKQEVLLETEAEAQNTEREIRVKAEVKSAKFRKSAPTKKIEFWLQKPSQEMKIDFRSKLTLHYSDSEQPISVESYLERKPIDRKYARQQQTAWYRMGGSTWLNNTLHFRISDQKKVDFQLTAHASPVTVGVAIDNQSRRQREKQWAHLFVQSEPSSGAERRFLAFASTNQQRYRVEGAWLDNRVTYQVTNEKSGQKSDVTLQLVGKCVQWEARDVIGRKEKYDLCLNLDNQSDASAEVTLQQTGSDGQQRQLSANVEVDTRSGPQSVKVDVTWTPEMVDQFFRQLNDYYNSADVTSGWRHVMDEVADKAAILWSAAGDQWLIPVGQLFSDQFGDLIQEFGRHFADLYRVEQLYEEAKDYVYRKWQSVTSHVSAAVQSWQNSAVNNWWRPLARQTRKSCQKMEICYKLLYGLEKYGFEAVVDYFRWNGIRLLKESHRLVVLTSGRIYFSLPAAPQWFHDYRQSVTDTIASIIESNETLQSIAEAINRLFAELSKDFDAIDSSAVKKSAKKLATVLLDVSAHRVLVFDPQRGRFSLQVTSLPAYQSARWRRSTSALSSKALL